MQATFRYNIVQMVEGRFITTSPTDIFAWADVNDREIRWMSERRRSVLRPELRVQPQIEGLYGPMWDGEQDGIPAIRYEDHAAFRQLSA